MKSKEIQAALEKLCDRIRAEVVEDVLRSMGLGKPVARAAPKRKPVKKRKVSRYVAVAKRAPTAKPAPLPPPVDIKPPKVKLKAHRPRCGNCGENGHNARTCENEKVSDEEMDRRALIKLRADGQRAA
jgi:hypothetical protein